MDCRDVKCAWTGPCEVCVAVDFVFHFGLIRRARVSVCDSCTGGGRPAGGGVRRIRRTPAPAGWPLPGWESQIEVRARRMSLG